MRSFPEGATADHPDLTLPCAATQLAQGRLEDAAVQLALAESHVQVSAPDRRHRLKVELASLRLALARSSGHFTDVIEQVNLLDAAIADESNGPVALGSELRGVALMNLGIVEMWSGRFADAEQHLSEGAALAQAIGRPYLEVVCRAHLCFPSQLTAAATVRVRGEMAVALAERHGFDDRPILAPALGCLGGMAISACEFAEGERWLRRAWAVAGPRVDPAAAVLLHGVTGMLHAARGEHQSALQAFAAAARAQSLLTDVHVLTPRIAGWLAATQARLGMLDEARATVAELSAALGQIGLIHDRDMGAMHNALAVICLAEGNSAAALDSLRVVLEVWPPVVPALTFVEAHLLAGIAHLSLGDRHASAAATEAALEAAEPDRLIVPFAMTGAADLLDALPRHETAHASFLADIVDLLRGTPVPGPDRDPLPNSEALSPSELRVLRYLPTNLTRPEIARELYVSVSTVNTHIRKIYAKLGARNRSSAVKRGRELRLLSAGRSATLA